MTTEKHYNTTFLDSASHVTVTKRVRIMRVWITYYRKVL